MTFLAIETPDGKRDTVALGGPGGVSRLAVGKPGSRSAVWRVWANRKKSDVYVAVRNLAGLQKFSLHESGDWRYQWLDEQKAASFTGRTDTRIIDKWSRPFELGAGWTRGLSIWVPEQDVVAVVDDGDVAGDVTWIPRPQLGQVVGIHVTIAKPDRGFIQLYRTFPIDGFNLSSGESVLILVGVTEIDAAGYEWLENQRARVLSEVAWDSIDLSRTDSLRATLFGQDTEGHRMAWDLAVSPPKR
jgi:hypothetical protein